MRLFYKNLNVLKIDKPQNLNPAFSKFEIKSIKFKQGKKMSDIGVVVLAAGLGTKGAFRALRRADDYPYFAQGL